MSCLRLIHLEVLELIVNHKVFSSVGYTIILRAVLGNEVDGTGVNYTHVGNVGRLDMHIPKHHCGWKAMLSAFKYPGHRMMVKAWDCHLLLA